MSNKDEANEVGCDLEEKYGTTDFLKVCISAFTRFIVDKGLATEEELRQRFIDEAKRFNENKKDKEIDNE